MGNVQNIADAAAGGRQLEAFVGLLLAARRVLFWVCYCRAGASLLYCSCCDAELDEGRRAQGHASGCPVGGLAHAVEEIYRRVSIETLAAIWPLDAADAWDYETDNAPRKPPATAAAAGAVPVDWAPNTLEDFGEPWLVGEDGALVEEGEAWGGSNGRTVIDRNRQLMPASFEQARRIAAAVNLCAGAPTEGLERAFTEIAAATPQWALLALDISNLHRGHLAAIREFIDGVVKEAARPAPPEYVRPQ
jgi:hypothetical protein